MVQWNFLTDKLKYPTTNRNLIDLDPAGGVWGRSLIKEIRESNSERWWRIGARLGFHEYYYY